MTSSSYSDERARELAWAREKAARDEHGRILFAKEEGREEERAKIRVFLTQSSESASSRYL